MTDWVPQDDWSQVKVGDPVRAMRAEQMLTGKVVDRLFGESTIEDNVYAIVLEVPDLADVLTIHHGYWQLSVPAKPAVELPTEPGVYYGSQFGADVPFFLKANGVWRTSATRVHAPERHMPLVKLEPVTVTAKKVIEFIESDLTCDSYDTARKEFGVSDD